MPKQRRNFTFWLFRIAFGTVRCIRMERQVSLLNQNRVDHRRCPNDKPSPNAFRRSAPGVRFIARAMVFIGDLFREYCLSSLTSPLVQGCRLARFGRLFAIKYSCVMNVTKRVSHNPFASLLQC